MADAQLHAAILNHLRASAEPVREAFLFERVGSEITCSPNHFLAALVRLEVGGKVHVDPVRDDVRDPEPFQPRFWRVTT